MSAKKTNESKAEKNFENIGEALTTSEQFLEKNQKAILTGLLIVIVLVGAYLAYHYLYKVPRNEKAQTAIFKVSVISRRARLAGTFWQRQRLHRF